MAASRGRPFPAKEQKPKIVLIKSSFANVKMLKIEMTSVPFLSLTHFRVLSHLFQSSFSLLHIILNPKWNFIIRTDKSKFRQGN